MVQRYRTEDGALVLVFLATDIFRLWLGRGSGNIVDVK